MLGDDDEDVLEIARRDSLPDATECALGRTPKRVTAREEETAGKFLSHMMTAMAPAHMQSNTIRL